MQANQEPLFDWHQKLLIELFKAPLVKTRRGFAFTSIGYLLKFNLTNEFPVTKAKKLQFDTVARELFCFLRGYTSRQEFHKHGVHIWDADMDKKGLSDIGPVYGYQWRSWPMHSIETFDDFEVITFDQLQTAISILKENPASRKAVVSTWNVDSFENQNVAVTPCHILFQFNIVDGVLYTDVYQRSADLFLGLPFDIAEFAIISRLVANDLNIQEERLNYHISNLHLYQEHIAAAEQEIKNIPGNYSPQLNTFAANINTFSYLDCRLDDYPETRVIKAKLLV